MRLFVIQCCTSKQGTKELFPEPHSVLDDLPTQCAESLHKCRDNVRQLFPTRFGSKRLTTLSMYAGHLYSEDVKRHIRAGLGQKFMLLIMSGGYGLLRPDEIITEYDVDMSEVADTWSGCLPCVVQSYVVQNRVSEDDGIFSRSSASYRIAHLCKSLCHSVGFRIHYLDYHGGGAQKAVPELQGKLLLSLIGGEMPALIEGIPVRTDR
jgi:hypothetical protein